MDETEAVAELLARVRGGDRRSLARAISLVEDQAPEAPGLLALCAPHRGDALVIGITGPPGAGKSTLVDQMTRQLRANGQTVGIVAVDPTSPWTGGALLGDRIRMNGFAADDGVSIRSLASRGAKGGLATAADGTCALMEMAGRHVILLESMGVGQDEIEVVRLADLTVLVLVPGMGDDVQTLKAGIMEAADIYVINKSDRDGADRLRAEIQTMQEIGSGSEPTPVVTTVATTGAGIADLLTAIEARMQSVRIRRHLAAKPELTPGDPPLHLDHIGIAVRSIAEARTFYETLGLSVDFEETVQREQVKTALLSLGKSRLELLESTAAGSTIGRFLDRRGEGLHHIAIHADDLEGKFQELRRRGIRLVSDSIETGAGGHRYFFVHPASTGGVLVEIVGSPGIASASQVREGSAPCG